ncbi:alpha/beta hydrolase [Sphaerisporangium rubeum]|uniref:Acetyl esterase/lipase n=1 Tax=Sphaerisporangium rubeum TaxID=321317 RepID=A0A7X0IHK3_9ACTN|nr:alpha/beta hydrolase [Sphaerisporangium rubeum]MBB6475380.1 acetyl esterase/lipase [Sphaerisporangium rubeum]
MPITGTLADAVRVRAPLRSLGELPRYDEVTVTERTAPGPPGAPDVRVRVYRPRVLPSPAPAALLLHGGAFVLGNLDAVHDAAARSAAHASAVIVAVGYRLAPEHPYPAGLEDTYAALTWLAANAAGLGVDPSRIGVSGASSGAALATGVTMLSRDRGGPAVCFQHLTTPALDDRLGTASMLEYTGTPIWSRPLAEESWRMYLGPGLSDVSHYAAPARARLEHLTGLPAAYISTAGLDPVRDEGILYALRLTEAGVPVELHNYPGLYHAFGAPHRPEDQRRIAAEHLESLRRGLHGS